MSRRFATVICAASVALLVAHVLWVSDRLWVARALPTSGAIVFGNLLPLIVATFAGFAWRAMRGGAFRKSFLMALLALACLYRSTAPLVARTPTPLADRWSNDVCLQTSPSTCSAAAAATLLRAHGIPATEQEMARLCLTTDRGTTALGLYRGLTLKTQGTIWKVQAISGNLQTLRETDPILLSVRLDTRSEIDPRYENQWGWTPGVPHTVVFFGFTKEMRGDDRVEIGDPAVGREQWFVRDFQVLWHGEGLRLVPRHVLLGGGGYPPE
jgi:hypothetical protein